MASYEELEIQELSDYELIEIAREDVLNAEELELVNNELENRDLIEEAYGVPN